MFIMRLIANIYFENNKSEIEKNLELKEIHDGNPYYGVSWSKGYYYFLNFSMCFVMICII